MAASARELIPYLADAVPGWFQAALALYDAKGKELAYDDRLPVSSRPGLHCEIPKDGEYVIEIKDSIYRGREDFVYRITLGELPFVTSIFPLGGPAGAQTTVELKGWNLAGDQPDRDKLGAGRSSNCRAPERPPFEPRAVCRGHLAGMPGTGTERFDRAGATGHAPDHRQRAH